MTDAARAPKELMRRSFISAKEQAKEAAEQQQPQSEQPEQYAEERVERTADDAAHNVGDELLYRGKQLARKANGSIFGYVFLAATGHGPRRRGAGTGVGGGASAAGIK